MMKKRFLSVLAAGLFILTIAGSANAALTTIGTATYGGSDYKLIWDDDNNGNSIVWLDYTNGPANWSDQKAWAAGLDAQLTYNIDPAYNVIWDDTAAWRLPSAVDGAYSWGYDGTTTVGYNITTSEMGDLYYTELGNLASYDTSGNLQSSCGLNNTGDFEYLLASWYWSGTEYASNPEGAWNFNMDNGDQVPHYKDLSEYGLAVRGGQVSAVPVPGAIWLFGSGLAGMVALGRRRKGNRV